MDTTNVNDSTVMENSLIVSPLSINTEGTIRHYMPTFLSQPVITTGGPMKMEVSLTLMPVPDVHVAMVMYSVVKRHVLPSAAPTQSRLQENVVQHVPVVSEVFI